MIPRVDVCASCRVHLLLSNGIQPYLVFDGGFLPAKAGKEEERRKRRAANLERGRQLLREGNASGAHQFFSKAADVTPLMAHRLIKVEQFPPYPIYAFTLPGLDMSS